MSENASGRAAPLLESETQAVVEATANPPDLFGLGPVEGRKAVDEVQSGDNTEPEVVEEWSTVPFRPTGSVTARIVEPLGAAGPPPVIVYIHSTGWVFGNAHTHDRLLREPTVGVGAAVVFPEYDSPPEARYPVATGAELHRTALERHRRRPGVGRRSTGHRRKSRHRVPPPFATVYSPLRDAMLWFWDQYTADPAQRTEITVSPLRASTEQLAGVLPDLVITGEADVLRGEGTQRLGDADDAAQR